MKSKITKDFLEKYYIEKDMSFSDIARKFKLSKASLSRAAKRFNLAKSKDSVQRGRMKKFKETCLDRYGVENHFKLKEFQDKVKNTNMKKYGKESVLSISSFRDMAKVTSIKRYGTEFPSQSNFIKDKIKETNLEKYGVDSYLKTKELRSKLKDAAMERYNVESFSQSSEVKAKQRKTMLDRYGVDNPSKLESSRLKRINTKIKNGHIITIDSKTIIDWSKELDIPYDYLIKRINIKNSNYDDLVKFKNDYNNNVTNIERIVSNILGVSKFNKVVGGMDKKYRPDFKTDKMYINTDGLYWHSELKLDKGYHFNLREQFENIDSRIIQLRADEILYKTELVKSMLLANHDKVTSRIFARKCLIRALKQSEANPFLAENHLMGSIRARHFGLIYNDEVVSMISIKNYKKAMKIERFCSKKHIIVVGGFSKLLKYCFRNFDFSSINYWVDLRYGSGAFLEKFGFKEKRKTLGWKWTDFNKTYNRLRCRANMDSRRLSEKEYAMEKKWYKIYDAGQKLYRLDKE